MQANNVMVPTVIETNGRGERAWDPFSLLLKNRIIFVEDQITDALASVVKAQLLYLESEDAEADITMYINSPGGSVTAGLGIIDTMQYVRPNIITVNTGCCASMGAMILLCGTGKRCALENSETMIHQPLGGTQGQASDILIAAKNIEKTREKLYKIIAKKTGQEYQKVFDDCDRNFFMNAEETLAYGIIDEIMIGERGKLY